DAGDRHHPPRPDDRDPVPALTPTRSLSKCLEGMLAFHDGEARPRGHRDKSAHRMDSRRRLRLYRRAPPMDRLDDLPTCEGFGRSDRAAYLDPTTANRERDVRVRDRALCPRALMEGSTPRGPNRSRP